VSWVPAAFTVRTERAVVPAAVAEFIRAWPDPDMEPPLNTELPPNETSVTSDNPVPVMVTIVPPVRGPLDGETPVTAGGATYVNPSASDVALVPPVVVTVTSTAPAGVWAGDLALILVGEIYTTPVPAAVPNLTVDVLVNAVPVIFTVSLPVIFPLAGDMPVTAGTAL
jgi:hypothetical protein